MAVYWFVAEENALISEFTVLILFEVYLHEQFIPYAVALAAHVVVHGLVVECCLLAGLAVEVRGLEWEIVVKAHAYLHVVLGYEFHAVPRF